MPSGGSGHGGRHGAGGRRGERPRPGVAQRRHRGRHGRGRHGTWRRGRGIPPRRPLGLCLGGAGGPTPELFVADSLNYRVQRAPLPAACRDQAQPPALGYAGTTVAGGLGLGPGPEQLGQPVSVCLDDRGVLYVADADNGRVQVVPPAAQRAASERRPPASTLDDAQRTLTAGVVTEFREGPGFGFIKVSARWWISRTTPISGWRCGEVTRRCERETS
ncbi:unnamed protein product [Prorocentrum cordatum]|uniref:Uncharacterized protein n=1 Tax=Prorocentrum cordatum TaxID=2364126 RepID=A0ABN9PPK8_9DINO|nr:unnamed protein product [Polarella glacialis]